MHIGVAIFLTDRSITVSEIAREAEARGFDSFWVPEHTHIPKSRRSPWPGGADLPERYWRTLDPFVALTAAAMVTQRIRLGFGICLIIERDPIITAKAVASLDLVSGGRVDFGVGGGWNKEEMADHGTDPRHRWRLMRERVLAMKEVWTRDEPEFHGELVDFEPMWSWPKPLQRPLPIWVGGNVDNTLKRAIEWGDGWMPNYGRSDILAQLPSFRRMCDEAGRGHLPVMVFGARLDPDELNRFREAGVDRIAFWIPSDGREAALRRLDDLTPVRESLAA
jgi:probable F420-dependent oxidoreductase